MECEVIDIIEPEPYDKKIYQCLCCQNKNDISPQVQFDSANKLRVHLGVNHLQEYFLKFHLILSSLR